MHLAPLRRRPLRPSPAVFRFLPVVALLLLVGGCALPDPGPSPMVCPSTPGGCAKEDAPWYRQDVTAMIPPPPVEPPAPADPSAAAEATAGETAFEDPWSEASVSQPVTEPVVSSFAEPGAKSDAADTLSGAPTAAADPIPGGRSTAVGGQPPGKSGARAADAPAATVVRLPSDRLFDPGGDSLQPTGRRALDALADQLNGTSYTRIRVIGHTDRSGKATANLKLSRQRARAVRDHLATRGIPSEVLDHEGRGSRDAVIDPGRCGRRKDARIRCLAPDRRIDIVVTRRRTP